MIVSRRTLESTGCCEELIMSRRTLGGSSCCEDYVGVMGIVFDPLICLA